MVRSIFYKSEEREENPLTHRFLAICERLSSEGRATFFSDCRFQAILDAGDLLSVEEQVRLGKRQPDGILRFSDSVVAFENKVGSVHNPTTESGAGQLEYYHTHLQMEYKDRKPVLLILSDACVQGHEEILDIVDEGRIPRSDVVIASWQQVHKACVACTDSWKWDSSTRRVLTELDMFLIDELRVLLEDMGLAAYSGIERRDLESLAKIWGQLVLLNEFLTSEIAREFEMVKLYGRYKDYDSLLKEYLGFGFNAIPHHAWLYLELDTKNGRLNMGITMDDSRATKKLNGRATLASLAGMLDKASGFSVRIGPEKEHVDLVSLPDASASKDVFRGYLNISKGHTFEDLERELGLGTPEFPGHLMREFLKLKPIASLIGSKLSS